MTDLPLGFMRAFADVVLGKRHNPGANVAISPLVWNVEPGHDQRYWYFTVAAADRRGRFHLDQLKTEDGERDLAEASRGALVLELASRRPPCVLHLFDDELAMAKFCAATWPSPRTRRMLLGLQRERGAA
jgi:hypothetical protein